MHTFYLDKKDWNANELVLSKSESHHLSKVLRMQTGDNVLVLDGEGHEAHCKIKEIKKNETILGITDIITYPIPKARITLAVGWGKAARRGYLIEKSVELEAHALWFWHAERSQFPLSSDIKTTWQNDLIAGIKQCRNPFIPHLKTLQGGAKDIINASSDFQYKHILVEKDYPHEAHMSEEHLACEGDTLCVIGPEGGFTPNEVSNLLQAGFTPLSLGDRILRWETAALMALGLHWWKKQEKK